MRSRLSFAAVLHARMLHAMLHTPRRSLYLRELTGLGRDAVERALSVWRKEKLIHVADWAPDTLGRRRIPMYMVGDKLDVPRPRSSRQEIQQRYRNKRDETASVQHIKEQAEWVGAPQ